MLSNHFFFLARIPMAGYWDPNDDEEPSVILRTSKKMRLPEDDGEPVVVATVVVVTRPAAIASSSDSDALADAINKYHQLTNVKATFFEHETNWPQRRAADDVYLAFQHAPKSLQRKWRVDVDEIMTKHKRKPAHTDTDWRTGAEDRQIKLRFLKAN